MMEETGGYEIIEIRDDGTYVIMLNGNPFHVTPEYRPDLWTAVKAQLEAQAAVYVAAHLPPEPPVIEEPGGVT